MVGMIRFGSLLFLILLFVFFAVVVLALPLFGQRMLHPLSLQTDSTATEIYRLRVPRTMLSLVAGSGLALAGLVFQALFRNPLATPYTLGVASGASFGAALYYQFGWRFTVLFLGIPGISWAAFGGALLAMSVVYFLARMRDTSSEQMLLAGVAVNFFFASLILLLQYIAERHNALRMLHWTMGGVADAEWKDCWRLCPLVIGSGLILFFLSRELNVLATGRDQALAFGVNVERLRTVLFLMSSLLVGAIVAVAGPIGFVGLMVPHIARMLVGPDHRKLIPATLFFGAIFLTLCDVPARSVIPKSELPVGIVTSLLGGPFFLWLLLRSGKRLG